MRGPSYNFCRQQVYDFDWCVCVSASGSGCMPFSHACSGCLIIKVVIALSRPALAQVKWGDGLVCLIPAFYVRILRWDQEGL